MKKELHYIKSGPCCFAGYMNVRRPAHDEIEFQKYLIRKINKSAFTADLIFRMFDDIEDGKQQGIYNINSQNPRQDFIYLCPYGTLVINQDELQSSDDLEGLLHLLATEIYEEERLSESFPLLWWKNDNQIYISPARNYATFEQAGLRAFVLENQSPLLQRPNDEHPDGRSIDIETWLIELGFENSQKDMDRLNQSIQIWISDLKKRRSAASFVKWKIRNRTGKGLRDGKEVSAAQAAYFHRSSWSSYLKAERTDDKEVARIKNFRQYKLDWRQDGNILIAEAMLPIGFDIFCEQEVRSMLLNKLYSMDGRFGNNQVKRTAVKIKKFKELSLTHKHLRFVAEIDSIQNASYTDLFFDAPEIMVEIGPNLELADDGVSYCLDVNSIPTDALICVRENIKAAGTGASRFIATIKRGQIVTLGKSKHKAKGSNEWSYSSDKVTVKDGLLTVKLAQSLHSKDGYLRTIIITRASTRSNTREDYQS